MGMIEIDGHKYEFDNKEIQCPKCGYRTIHEVMAHIFTGKNLSYIYRCSECNRLNTIKKKGFNWDKWLKDDNLS